MNTRLNLQGDTMSTNSEVRTIITMPGAEDFQLFLSTPSNIHPYYRFQVEEKNQLNQEFLYKCIVITKGNLPVGRVAIYKNPKLSFKGKLCAGIGNYECIDDLEISKRLLQTAIDYIQKEDIDFVIGPFNGSIWDDYRFSEYHKNDKNIGFFKEPFHPVYYNRQFVDFGFNPISRYSSRINRDFNIFNKLNQNWEVEGISFRTLDMDHFEEELDKVYSFCMEAFSHNFLSTPISKEGFNKIYLPAANCVEGEYVIFAENNKREIVGMVFGVIDFLETDEKRLIIRTLGRRNDLSLKGLGAELVRRFYQKAVENEFDAVIHAFMDFGVNQNPNSLTMIGEAYQTYLLYGKSIE